MNIFDSFCAKISALLYIEVKNFKSLSTPYFIAADVFMKLVWALKRSILLIDCELPPPVHPPSDDRNNQAVSCQAIFATTGPHQLITSRNHVLTDGPMHIDRSALPRSKSPNANESFPVCEKEGKKH